MTIHLPDLKHFRCPRFRDLPAKPCFNQEAVHFVTQALAPLDLAADLTTTMVQNYVKWGFLERPQGRKYERTHVAYLLVITVYKAVLPLAEVKRGVDLQLGVMTLPEAYDTFAGALDLALTRVFHNLFDGKSAAHLPALTLPKEQLGVSAVAEAFAFRLLGRYILQENGLAQKERQ